MDGIFARLLTGACVTAIALALLITNDSFASGFCPVVDTAGQPACGDSVDIGSSAPNGNSTQHVGNPIDVVSGNKYQSDVDVRLGGSALSFVRHYNSSQTSTNIGLGNGWRHTYSVVLSRPGKERLDIVQSDGRLIAFVLQGNRYETRDERDGYVLFGENNRHTWYLPDGRKFVFFGSYLVQILFADSGYLELQYANARLDTITDELQRTLKLVYEPGPIGLPSYTPATDGVAAGHIKALMLPNGSNVEFEYDASQNLKAAIYAAGDFHSRGHRYRYEDKRNNRLLTERITAMGRVLGRWEYDELGRAVSYRSKQNIRVNGTDRGTPDVLLNYSTNEEEHGGTTLVNYEDGKVEEYVWSVDGGVEIGVTVTESTEESPGEHNHVESVAMDFESTVKDSPVGHKATVSSLSVISLDDLGNPDLVRLSTDDSDESHVLESEYDQTGKLLQVKWLRGEFLSADGVLFDASNSDEISALYQNGNLTDDQFLKLFSAVAEIGRIRSEARTLLEAGEWDVDDEMGEGEKKELLIKNKDSAYDFRAQNRTTLQSTNGAASPACANPLFNCNDLLALSKYAELSSCVYLDDDDPCTSPLVEVNLESLGLELSDIVEASFRSEIYYDVTADEYVISFAGTDITSIGDWRNNIRQDFGQSSYQYRLAVRLARRLRNLNPNLNFKFTGHSLGGGLATAAAAAIGAEAIVFNPAALNVESAGILGINYGNAVSNTSIFSIDGDILYEVQTQVQANNIPAGNFNTLPAPSFAWQQSNLQSSNIFTYPTRLGMLLHSMRTVKQSLSDLLAANNCTP